MLAPKKPSRFNNKFPWNLKILALLLMMRKITLVVKFDEKYVHNLIILPHIQVWVWRIPGWDSGSSPACVVKFSAGMARQT